MKTTLLLLLFIHGIGIFAQDKFDENSLNIVATHLADSIRNNTTQTDTITQINPQNSKIIYHYDKHNAVIIKESLLINSEFEIHNRRTEFFNTQNKHTLEIISDLHSKIIFLCLFSYNDKGELCEKKIYDSKLIYKISYAVDGKIHLYNAKGKEIKNIKKAKRKKS